MRNTLISFFSRLFLFSFIFFLNYSLLYAQWPTTPTEALFVDYGLYPYLVVDEQEESVIVIYISGDDMLKAKKYDRYGYPQWGGQAVTLVDTALAFGINLSNLSNQWGAVVSDDSGGAIVCWQDYRHSTFDPYQTPENNEIYIQRVDRDGQVRYGMNGKRISTPASAGWHSLGDMKPDYHDGFVVGYYGDTTMYAGAVKRFHNNGNLIWEEYFPEGFNLDINATNVQGNIFISYGGAFGQPNRRMKLDLSGNLLWPDTLDGKIPDSRAYRGGGAFSDQQGGVIGVGDLELKINRVDSTGQYVFGPNGIDLGQGQQGRIGYAPDGAGGIYVSWKKNGSRLQRISRKGVISFNQNGLIVPPDSINFAANFIVSDQMGGVLYFFLDTRTFPSHYYYIQRIDSSGQFQWDSLGVAFYSTPGDAGFALSARPFYSDMRGGAIYVWAEEQAGFGVRIFLKQISQNGNLGEVIASLPQDEGMLNIPEEIELKAVYPNPFNSSTTIELHLHHPAGVQLAIYDLRGRKIKTLLKKNLTPNSYQIRWDGADQAGRLVASGIYFCRLVIDGQTYFSRKIFFIK